MQYVLILVWIGIAAVFIKNSQANKTQLADGIISDISDERVTMLFAIVVFIPLIILATFRDLNFGDAGAYDTKFYFAPTSLDDVWDYVKNQEKDHGFYYFLAFIKVFITKDSTIFFLIISIIQGIILIWFFRNYSSNYVYSVFLFVASADYLSWMHNGTRQFMAALFILAATPLLLKKKYVPLILIILFASTFHQSALIMIPMIFLVQGEAWNKKTLIFIALIILAIAFVGRFTGFLDSSMQETQYSDVVTKYTESGDDGTNPIRVLVYSVPTLIAIYGYKKLKEEKNHFLDVCVNMSILSTGFYAVSIFTSGMYLGRIPIYFSLFNYILLPWEIDIIFEEDMRKTINLMAMSFYLAFYIYQVHFTWGLF